MVPVMQQITPLRQKFPRHTGMLGPSQISLFHFGFPLPSEVQGDDGSGIQVLVVSLGDLDGVLTTGFDTVQPQMWALEKVKQKNLNICLSPLPLLQLLPSLGKNK